MSRQRWGRGALVSLVLAAFAGGSAAHAQSALDKIVQSKTLRCGVQLDYPPAGFRNQKNEPDGYDVAYCKDMAKALGATAQIVETPSSERIPALVSNRIDVLIASASITTQRALTVAFSQPYVSYTNVVLTRKDTGVEKFDDMKGLAIGGVTGTTTEQDLKALYGAWKDAKGSYTGYGSEAESYLALTQGKIDGIILGNASAGALVRSGQFPTLVIKGSNSMVNSRRAAAKGVANNSGQMVERVIRHPFLTWLCGNTNVRQDAFLLQEQSAKIED